MFFSFDVLFCATSEKASNEKKDDWVAETTEYMYISERFVISTNVKRAHIVSPKLFWPTKNEKRQSGVAWWKSIFSHVITLSHGIFAHWQQQQQQKQKHRGYAFCQLDSLIN